MQYNSSIKWGLRDNFALSTLFNSICVRLVDETLISLSVHKRYPDTKIKINIYATLECKSVKRKYSLNFIFN